MADITRRHFIGAFGGTIGAGLACAAAPRLLAAPAAAVPSYLKDYQRQYAANPRAAAIEWVRGARFGLFIHYGLYSVLGRHEWVQLREKIPVAEYAKIKDRFTAEKFDADFITDLALAAGMKYINITTRHHDSFCLFDTQQTDFKSTNSPAKRDLVRELTEQCGKKGLGIFYYYSHGRDWKHPHAPNNDRWGGSARPNYSPPEPSYATGAAHDLGKYVAFMKAQVTELLSNYGPVAGIWLDGIATTKGPKAGTGASTADFHCQELYDHVHALQPQVLVSYKQGLLGTEDFFAPEHRAIQNEGGKPMEICTTLQKNGWGYVKDSPHLSADDVIQRLAAAAAGPANLLLNTGPLGDGSIHADDVKTLREVENASAPAVGPRRKRPRPSRRSGRKRRRRLDLFPLSLRSNQHEDNLDPRPATDGRPGDAPVAVRGPRRRSKPQAQCAADHPGRLGALPGLLRRNADAHAPPRPTGGRGPALQQLLHQRAGLLDGTLVVDDRHEPIYRPFGAAPHPRQAEAAAGR